jgi:hypothetical protein
MLVNKPDVDHYQHGTIQSIDYMAASFTPPEFCGYLKGNILKYLARYQHKGAPIEDLNKAQTYLFWLIEFEGNRPASETPFPSPLDPALIRGLNSGAAALCRTKVQAEKMGITIGQKEKA